MVRGYEKGEKGEKGEMMWGGAKYETQGTSHWGQGLKGEKRGKGTEREKGVKDDMI